MPTAVASRPLIQEPSSGPPLSKALLSKALPDPFPGFKPVAVWQPAEFVYTAGSSWLKITRDGETFVRLSGSRQIREFVDFCDEVYAGRAAKNRHMFSRVIGDHEFGANCWPLTYIKCQNPASGRLHLPTLFELADWFANSDKKRKLSWHEPGQRLLFTGTGDNGKLVLVAETETVAQIELNRGDIANLSIALQQAVINSGFTTTLEGFGWGFSIRPSAELDHYRLEFKLPGRMLDWHIAYRRELAELIGAINQTVADTQ